MVNSVDLDEKMSGYDCALVEKITGSVNVPVIACGGASVPKDCSQLIRSGASAVAAASIFHFTHYTPNDCKLAMKEEGIPVR